MTVPLRLSFILLTGSLPAQDNSPISACLWGETILFDGEPANEKYAGQYRAEKDGGFTLTGPGPSWYVAKFRADLRPQAIHRFPVGPEVIRIAHSRGESTLVASGHTYPRDSTARTWVALLEPGGKPRWRKEYPYSLCPISSSVIGDDGLVWVSESGRLVRVGPEGDTIWTWMPPWSDRTRVHSLRDGRLLLFSNSSEVHPSGIFLLDSARNLSGPIRLPIPPGDDSAKFAQVTSVRSLADGGMLIWGPEWTMRLDRDWKAEWVGVNPYQYKYGSRLGEPDSNGRFMAFGIEDKWKTNYAFTAFDSAGKPVGSLSRFIIFSDGAPIWTLGSIDRLPDGDYLLSGAVSSLVPAKNVRVSSLWMARLGMGNAPVFGNLSEDSLLLHAGEPFSYGIQVEDPDLGDNIRISTGPISVNEWWKVSVDSASRSISGVFNGTPGKIQIFATDTRGCQDTLTIRVVELPGTRSLDRPAMSRIKLMLSYGVHGRQWSLNLGIDLPPGADPRKVEAFLFDPVGQRSIELASEPMGDGTHRMSRGAGAPVDLRPGVYLLRIKAGRDIQSRTLPIF